VNRFRFGLPRRPAWWYDHSVRRLPPIDPVLPFAALGLFAMLLGGLCSTARADDPVSSLVRYNREIVRIFERKCIACHTDNNLSFPLDGYHDVRPWAQAIREEILERRMPPWPAATGVRPLVNELGLTTREIAIITAWIDGGTPRGEPGDLPPPKPQVIWKAGEPDLKVALPIQHVKPDGVASVRRVTLATGLTGERWLRGFDVVPGERRALRSVFLFLERAGGAETWLGGWTPWHAMTTAPEGVGFHVPAGASLVAEMHYLAWEENDEPLADQSTLGLYFRDRPGAVIQEMKVAAAARDDALRGETPIAQDVVIWALRPRFERDGVAAPGFIEIRAIKPDGSVEPLLWVNDNRPDWQLPYVLREPLQLARGARIVVTAYEAGKQKAGGATAVASVLTYPPLTAQSTEPSPRR